MEKREGTPKPFILILSKINKEKGKHSLTNVSKTYEEEMRRLGARGCGAVRRAVSVCWGDETEGSTSCTYPVRVRLVLWVRVENL